MAASEDPAGALTLRRAGTAGFLVGGACMVVELTAVRLLAPHFGDSAYVWTNVIGVILAALALGAGIGGVLAERIGARLVGPLLLVSAGLTAFAPFAGRSLGPWLLPQDLPLDAAMPALVRGSLAATVLLFGPAIALVGAVSPALVVGVVRGGTSIGRAAGLVSAASTIGSLIGTYAATHVLVPELGSRLTLCVAAGLLACAAVAVGRARAAAAAIAFVVGCGLLATGPARAVREGQQLLAEVESKQQFLQVVRTPGEGTAPARVELKINEGLDSYHSVAIEGAATTSEPGRAPRSYYDFHALTPWFAGDGERPRDLRVLSVGDAAGTIRRVYAAVHPGAVVDGVELDPFVVALGDRWFPGARAPGVVVAGLDGRVYVERAQAKWHVVHVDAYSHQVYVPAHLASVEFFRAVAARLEPKGVLACNVGGLGVSDPVVRAIGCTMATVFADVVALRIPDSRNLLVVGRRDAPIDPSVLARVPRELPLATPRDAEVWSRVVDTASSSEWSRFASDESVPVLCDDRPVLDALLQRSYVEAHGERALVAVAGGTSKEGAEAEAFAAFSRGDAKGALRAVASSREQTAYLRYLAGVSQWSLRHLEAADAEFEASAATADVSLQPVLANAREGLALELAPRRHAAQIASRNAWIAAGAVAAALLLAAALVYRMSRMPLWPSVSVDTAAR